MSAFATVIYKKEGPVAWVTLNRPHALNAYNTVMRDELYQVLQAVRDDPEVEGVILRGAGERAFCAGADLTEFGTAPSPAIARQARWARDIWGLFLTVRQPLVAALHGFVLGSGLEIALCCDLRVAAENAVLGLPEVGLGMIPAAGGTQTLPRLVGLGPSLELLLTGRRLGATEAHALGLVSEVVAPHELLPASRRLLEGALRGGPLAVRLAKQAVWEGSDLPLDRGLALERRLASLALSRRAGRAGRRRRV
ncbi:MAG: enoyl-CoA hydratase/isomerase family protein [Chloroflexi bacterium]|nr:enoyl-CoA hydratase/isomerase family protein [Chloroflexota bacterium]